MDIRIRASGCVQMQVLTPHSAGGDAAQALCSRLLAFALRSPSLRSPSLTTRRPNMEPWRSPGR